MQRQHQQHHQEDRQYPQQMSLPPSSSQPHYEQENRLPQIGRSQHQQYNQSHCHSYHGHPSGSGSGSFGPELPQLSSIEFSQRHLIDPESRPGSSASSGRPNSSGSAVFSFLPHPPIPSTMNNQSHGSHSRMASMSLRDGGSTSTPASSSVMSLPSAHHLLPGTEGMTVVRNEEGAIMVYNPITDAMTFRCELCPEESFGRIHDLKRHQTSKHQEMTWPCDFCHRPFVRRDALLRHYTVKAAKDDGLHPASHEVDKLLAARARAKMLY
ncbi:hypothetical protein BGX23_001569 [Mortierella sp. AD031]|nr:hypothetical protein BGX23_001569 [Mortierella sp. AD031]